MDVCFNTRGHMRVAGLLLWFAAVCGCNGYSVFPAPTLTITDPEWACIFAETKDDCQSADTEVASNNPDYYCAWYSAENNPDGLGFGFRDKALSGTNPVPQKAAVEDAIKYGKPGLCRLYVYVPPPAA
jgi:hypothetical protein